MTGYTGPAGQLTTRQRQVFDLVKAELSRRQIAARLGISEETVKQHVKDIRYRLDARTTAQTATQARRTGVQQ